MDSTKDTLMIILLVLATLASIVGLAFGSLLTPVVLWRRCKGYRFPTTEALLSTVWAFFLTGVWFLVNKTDAPPSDTGVLPAPVMATVSLAFIAVGSIGLIPACLIYRRESKTAKRTPRRR